MKTQDFLNQIESTYATHFPNSKIFCKYSQKSLFRNISITCKLAGNNQEISGGYWDNDIFHITFFIGNSNGRQFLSTMTLDSDLPETLNLENHRKHYMTKPEDVYCVYGSKKVSFRKAKGDAAKLITSLDKFFVRLKASVVDDLATDNIHKNHRDLVLAKIV